MANQNSLEMDKLYSERNGLREIAKKTSIIDIESYGLLWDCCEKYKINLAWKYPLFCSDFSGRICELDEESFQRAIKRRIPRFYSGCPSDSTFVSFFGESFFNTYSILDYIEFISKNMKSKKAEEHHSYGDYGGHYHYAFMEDDNDFQEFRIEINETFDMCDLLYNLSEEKIVIRAVKDDFIIQESKVIIDVVPEKELKVLLEESIALHKSRNPNDHHLATEKIWDALERLKTIYIDEKTDKKSSSNRIIDQMAKGDANYINLFSTEFHYLTTIGNNYRIRHHEIGKTDIPQDEYYDYFFGRCFPLIVLALKSLS